MPRSKKTDPDANADTPASLATPPAKTLPGALPNVAEAISTSGTETEDVAALAATAVNTQETKPKREPRSKVAAVKIAEPLDGPNPAVLAIEKYSANGVLFSREVPSVYEPVKITYRGILAQNGATELYARAGIGPCWQNVQEVAMTKTIDGFEGVALAVATSTLNVCFRDAAYNWDNNSNENYVFTVTT